MAGFLIKIGRKATRRILCGNVNDLKFSRGLKLRIGLIRIMGKLMP